jgi:methionyl-tRNA formyltransferase
MLKVGFLGMSDNRATMTMLDVLENSDVEINCRIYLKPSLKDNWKRLKRKFLSQGFLHSFQRVLYSLKLRVLTSRKPNINITRSYIFYVRSFSSVECHQIIKDHNLDLLLLCTDEMIKRSTFQLPKIGTLNAHPGWIPNYRGLGAIHKMVEDGFLPAISVHYINEGVDTGKLVLREHCELDVVGSHSDAEISLNRAQASMFIKAVKLIDANRNYWHDTFLEQSSMTRGYPKNKFNDLYLDFANVKAHLKPFDN